MAWVQSLIGELRSHKAHSAAKTKQKTKHTHTKTDKKIKKLDPGFMTYCVDLTSWQFIATIQKMRGSNKYLCSKVVVRIK